MGRVSKPTSRSALAAVAAATALLACAGKPPEPPLTQARDRPSEVREYLVRAAEAHQRGYPLRTEELLRKASEAAPDDLDIALDLGDTLNRLGRNEAARAHYAAFLGRHPSSTQARVALGLTLLGLGRWEEAARQLRRAAEEQPRDPVAHSNLGSVLSRLGKNEEALAHLRAALEQSPSDPEIHAALGVAYLRLGRIPEATTALEKAVDLDPANATALHNLGNCYARSGRSLEAERVFERFARASRKKEEFIDEKRLFRAAQARAFELAQAGNDEKALEALLAYRESLRDFPLFHQELGVAYLKLGRSREAVSAFERAVELDPSLAESHSQLVALYQQAGEREKAMKAREAAARPASTPAPAPPPGSSPSPFTEDR